MELDNLFLISVPAVKAAATSLRESPRTTRSVKYSSLWKAPSLPLRACAIKPMSATGRPNVRRFPCGQNLTAWCTISFTIRSLRIWPKNKTNAPPGYIPWRSVFFFLSRRSYASRHAFISFLFSYMASSARLNTVSLSVSFSLS